MWGSGGRAQATGCLLHAWYARIMATLHISNVPDELHERLRRIARKTNSTMRAIVLATIEKELERSEWLERMANRPVVDPGVSAALMLEEARAERDRELDEALAPRPGRASPAPSASAQRRR